MLHRPSCADGLFSNIIEEKLMRKYVGMLKDIETRHIGFIKLQGCLTNNAMCSDLFLIDGTIELLKECTKTEPCGPGGCKGTESPARKLLGRMGFTEYDDSLEENRDREYFEIYGRPPEVDENFRTIKEMVPGLPEYDPNDPRNAKKEAMYRRNAPGGLTAEREAAERAGLGWPPKKK
jgi:hypothetical protein